MKINYYLLSGLLSTAAYASDDSPNTNIVSAAPPVLEQHASVATIGVKRAREGDEDEPAAKRQRLDSARLADFISSPTLFRELLTQVRQEKNLVVELKPKAGPPNLLALAIFSRRIGLASEILSKYPALQYHLYTRTNQPECTLYAHHLMAYVGVINSFPFIFEDGVLERPNSQGLTILHIAAANGDMDTIRNLSRRVGKDYYRINKELFSARTTLEGYTPMILAAQRGYVEIIQLLHNNDASLCEQVDNYGRTAFHYAYMNGHSEAIKLLYKFNYGTLSTKLDHWGKNGLFYSYHSWPLQIPSSSTDRFQVNCALGCLDIFLTPPPLSQQQLDTAFAAAIRFDDQDEIERIFSSGEQLRPSYQAFYDAVLYAVKQNQLEKLSWLINNMVGDEDKQQALINNALYTAAGHGNLEIIEWLMKLVGGKLGPDQEGINYAFQDAVVKEQRRVVEMLITWPIVEARPDRDGINEGFTEALRQDKFEICEWLLTHPIEDLRPDQALIIEKYRDECEEYAEGDELEMINFLARHVPEAERRNQNIGNGRRGVAFDIHNYADATVTDSSAVQAPLTLIQAVFNNMGARIADLPASSFGEAAAIINENIIRYIPLDQQANALKAVFEKFNDDIEFKQLIALTLTFLQNFYPSAMETWIRGFVYESITAYDNSISGISCSKGIKERIATGLRGIDPGLDALFNQVEGPRLRSLYVAQWNPTNLLKVSELLIAMNITASQTLEEALEIIRPQLSQTLASYTSAEDSDIPLIMDTIVAVITDNYPQIQAQISSNSALTNSKGKGPAE